MDKSNGKAFTRETCGGCGCEIDPEVCGCGDYIDHPFDGHYGVPMGCACGYVTASGESLPPVGNVREEV